jgi:hypothetical protein
MNINLFNLALLGCIIIFATIIIIIMLIKNRQKNVILNAFQKSKNLLKTKISNDEERLKRTLGAPLMPELEKKIMDVIAVEKDSYNNLLNLFVDYHPAAIEMMPVFMDKITESYVHCIEQIILLNKIEQSKEINIPVENSPQNVILDGDPSEDDYQYEALIEQLRFEKQDYADKYKNAHKLLEKIYLAYKDKLEISGPETFENMNLTEIENILKVTSS